MHGTTDGLLNFISDGCGGRASDFTIEQDCKYLQCLPPNKAVMADRKFKDLSRLLQANLPSYSHFLSQSLPLALKIK